MSEVKVFKVWNGWNPYFIDGPITDKEEELVFKADFDAVVKERDELRAENERLKTPINSDFFAELITQWKSFWMNQTQNNEKDRQNYFNRALGVDANMEYDLANRIVKALRGADEN